MGPRSRTNEGLPVALGSPSNAIPGGKGLALSRVSDEGGNLARKNRRSWTVRNFLLFQNFLQSGLCEVLGA